MVTVWLEYFRLAVTYLQFPIRASFQSQSVIRAVAWPLCSSCYLELWPVTLAFELDLGGGRVNRRAKYLDETSFSSQVPDTHTHTHTQWTDCFTKTSKVVGKSSASRRCCRFFINSRNSWMSTRSQSVNILLALTLRRFLRGWVGIFSELYAIARPSVVCNVRAPYSRGSNFRQYFYGIRYLGHPLTSTENFTVIVPGQPLRRGS